GLIERLLGVFGLGKKKAEPARQPFDREPYRQRAQGLLQRLRGVTATDAAARRGELRAVLPELESLFKDLIAAGERDPSARALGEVLLRLQTTLAAPGPADDAVHGLWAQTESALRDWLAVGQKAAEPRREGFW